MLGESIDVPGNARCIWVNDRPLIWLLLVTMVLDAVSTTAFMHTLGVDRELNPLVRHCADWLGLVAGPMVGKSGQLFGAAGLVIMAPRLARVVLALVILLNLAAFVVNTRVFLLNL